MLQKLEIDVPDGFELTGEYRPVRKGDWYLGECDARFYEPGRCEFFPHIILRKKWTPPKWLPEGCWIYQTPSLNWFITNYDPKPYRGRFGVQEDAVTVNIKHLAMLHGDTFVPPPVNKIQVKHG